MFHTHKSQASINGPVKKLIEYRWDCCNKYIDVKEYDVNGNLTQSRSFGQRTLTKNRTGKNFPPEITELTDTNKLNLQSTSSWIYSSTGKLLMAKMIDEIKQQETFSLELKYDENDSLISVREINDFSNLNKKITYINKSDTLIKTVIENNSDTLIQSKIIRNEQGQLFMITSKYYDEEGVSHLETMIFNEFGKLHVKYFTKSPEAESNIGFDKKKQYTYNSDRLLVKTSETITTDRDTTRDEKIFHYDSIGLITKELRFWYENNVLDVFQEINYDENQNQINWFAKDYIIDSSSFTAIADREHYEYRYDSHNNWTEKKIFVDGKISEQLERIIEYY